MVSARYVTSKAEVGAAAAAAAPPLPSQPAVDEEDSSASTILGRLSRALPSSEGRVDAGHSVGRQAREWIREAARRESRALQVFFTGCSWGGVYHVGAAAALHEQGVAFEKFSGASSGRRRVGGVCFFVSSG